MVNVSSAKLKKESMNKVFLLFYEIAAKGKNRQEFIQLMSEILSPTEQIMLAKRIVIFYLLVKGVTQTDIKDALKVSNATVSRYALMLHHTQTSLQKDIERLLIKESIQNILEDVFYGLFLQPGIKKGHWATYWQHEKDKKQRKTSGV